MGKYKVLVFPPVGQFLLFSIVILYFGKKDCNTATLGKEQRLIMRKIYRIFLIFLLIACLFFLTSCKNQSPAGQESINTKGLKEKDGYLLCPDGSASSLHYSQMDKWVSERGWSVLNGDKEKEAYYMDLIENWANQYCD